MTFDFDSEDGLNQMVVFLKELGINYMNTSDYYDSHGDFEKADKTYDICESLNDVADFVQRYKEKCC